MAIGLSFLGGPGPTRAEVIHGVNGVMDMNLGAPYCVCGYEFDFETQQPLFYPPYPPDLTDLGALSSGEQFSSSYPITFRLLHGATGLAVVDSTLEALTTAPPLPYANTIPGPAIGRTYVVLTGEGRYVKFAVRTMQEGPGFGEVGIEFYVQMDGTPYFGPTVAVRPTTWGRIKALYR